MQCKLTSHRTVILPDRRCNWCVCEPANMYIWTALFNLQDPILSREGHKISPKGRWQRETRGNKIISSWPSLFIKLTDSQCLLNFSIVLFVINLGSLERVRHLCVQISWWLVIIVDCIMSCFKDLELGGRHDGNHPGRRSSWTPSSLLSPYPGGKFLHHRLSLL